MAEINIGIVGYSAQKFNEEDAKRMIFEAYNMLDAKYADQKKVIISGLTDLGIPALAYREAVRRGWKTVGIACKKAVEFACFPVDETKIIGNEWGDESPSFLKSIDVLVRIGGGNQAKRETLEAKANGKGVIEYELPSIKLGGN